MSLLFAFRTAPAQQNRLEACSKLHDYSWCWCSILGILSTRSLLMLSSRARRRGHLVLLSRITVCTCVFVLQSTAVCSVLNEPIQPWWLSHSRVTCVVSVWVYIATVWTWSIRIIKYALRWKYTRADIHILIRSLDIIAAKNFVTPFSTLAMIQGSLPTNSTTPDRLRRWARPLDEDFTVFWRGKASKKSFFFAPTIESWSTPQKKPIAGFSWPGGQ